MRIRLTTEQFVKKAKLVHGDKYNYDLVNYINSQTKVKIKCNQCNKIFEQIPSSHLNGKGCSICNHQKGAQKRNIDIINKNGSLKDNDIELCLEWDYEKNYPLRPENFTYNSQKIIWWKCKNGHEWLSSINNRSRNKGSNCPYCYGRNATEKNNLLIKNPELCKEWNYEKNGDLKSENFTAQSNKKVWWVCKNGHEWVDSITHRANDRNCPYCSGRRVLKGFNDLQTLRPDIAKDWDYERNFPLTPDQFTYGSTKKVWWLCKNKHTWKVSINQRTNMISNCPYCCIWDIQEKCRQAFENIFKIKFIKKRFYCFKKVDGTKSKSFIEFDGYNEELKITFEYQGYQHYQYPNRWHKTKTDFQKLRSKDLFKRQFCLENNIKLIIIPFQIKEKDFENYIKGELTKI